MCLPGICDPFDLEDCCGGSGTAAPQARQRPVQQPPIRQQRAGVPAAAAVRPPRPTQVQGQGQQMQYPAEPQSIRFLWKAGGYLRGPMGGTDTLPTVNVSRTPRGWIVLAGVPKGLPSIKPYEQGQLVSGCLRNVTKSYLFSNAQYYRTRKGLVILKGGQVSGV
ncbi:hypothetical protein BO86DRAFT_403072 [Aspergillus japonicus CBS 114.51]|uniref:Uncharacterized protein n=2 Tax=Aspergillus TaxID=5052 RepID=A0A2V5GX21_ASPV1|nr:hypothetical protein BO86DRAFT_403072 [Aspergillus japonicus CBS 114.51]PYI16059.1 hypothetical protein BO99DRAFT_233885 [Aspergillus violaceofuscus CBS 115571]RAH78112.1 hypothetical protein BO86DRAFT_403072 [Aspergillus japonicus CBS 114.51]